MAFIPLDMIKRQTLDVAGLNDENQSPDTGVEISDQGDVRTVTIRVGEELDRSANDIFTRAITEAQHDVGNLIVVDLANTRRITDSGLALLIKLNERSWRTACKVRIVNCNPELHYRITHHLDPGTFNLSLDCSELETFEES